MKTDTTKPKLKETTKKRPIKIAKMEANPPIINVAGAWKADTDMILARHGKDILQLASRMEQHRKAINTHKEIIDDILDEMRSIKCHCRELSESIQNHRVILAINLALVFGLMIAVAYCITR